MAGVVVVVVVDRFYIALFSRSQNNHMKGANGNN